MERSRFMLLGLQQGKEDHFADRSGSGEDHREPVDADAETAGRRHAVLERRHELFVRRHRFLVAGLALRDFGGELLALDVRIVLLGVGVRHFFLREEQLEAVGQDRLPGFGFGQRRERRRKIEDERRLIEVREECVLRRKSG